MYTGGKLPIQYLYVSYKYLQCTLLLSQVCNIKTHYLFIFSREKIPRILNHKMVQGGDLFWLKVSKFPKQITKLSFARSINPISTRVGGGKLSPPNTMCPPRFSDLPTALKTYVCIRFFR